MLDCLPLVSGFVEIMMGKRSRIDIKDELPKNATAQDQQDESGSLRESFKRIKVNEEMDNHHQPAQLDVIPPVYFSARVNTRDLHQDIVNYQHNNELGNLVQDRRNNNVPKHDEVNYSEMNKILGQRFQKM